MRLQNRHSRGKRCSTTGPVRSLNCNCSFTAPLLHSAAAVNGRHEGSKFAPPSADASLGFRPIGARTLRPLRCACSLVPLANFAHLWGLRDCLRDLQIASRLRKPRTSSPAMPPLGVMEGSSGQKTALRYPFFYSTYVVRKGKRTWSFRDLPCEDKDALTIPCTLLRV